MRNKLWFLTKISLKRKVDTKIFKIVNLLLLIAIVALMNIDSIIKYFGGDFDELTKVYVIDNTSYTFDVLKEQINTTSETINGESSFDITKYEKTEEEAMKEIEENGGLLFVINNDEKNVISAKLVSEGYIDTLQYQVLYQSISVTKNAVAVAQTNIDPNELNKIMSSVEVERVILDETKKTEDENMEAIMTTVFPIVILPFFMLTIFLVQMIGMEVNDEKTTRGMEIIISNVSPKTHFFSKVLSGNIFVISQGLLLLIYSGIGLLSRRLFGGGSILNGLGGEMSGLFDSLLSSQIIDKLMYIIPLTLILMIVTFVAYSLLAGILSSITTNAEDFSQMQTPIMIVLLVGYYLAIMAGVFKGALFIRILSYVPLISAILAPSLLVLGQIGIIDIIIAIILTIITNYILIKYGLKIYKIGILNYSSKDLWKKMFKAIKEN